MSGGLVFPSLEEFSTLLHFSFRDTQTGSKGVKKDIPLKWNAKESKVHIFISDKNCFMPKTVTRDKTMIMGQLVKRIQQL